MGILVDFRTNTTSQSGFYIGILNSGEVVFYDARSNAQFSFFNDVPSFQWVHLAVVKQQSNINAYINGINSDWTYNISNNLGFENPCYIGISAPLAGQNIPSFRQYIGYIDDLRITKGIARYTSNFTPPTGPFPIGTLTLPISSLLDDLVAYWSFDANNIEDDKLNYTATIDNGPATFEIGKYNTSLKLTQDKRLRVIQNLWNVKTNPLSYSVSFWVRPNQLANTGQETVLIGSCFGDMGFFINLGDTASSNFSNVFNQHVNFWLATGTSFQYENVLVPFVTTTGVWYHIAATYNLPNQTAKLYINGSLVGTETNILNDDCTNSGWTGFCLNGSPVGTTSSEYGKDYNFDMVGFWTRTLTDEEVGLLYSNYAEINNLIV
jgi:hypothetical protein